MDRKRTKEIKPAVTPAWAPWAGLIGRWAVGLVFIASGLIKAGGPAEEFAVVITAYRLVSPDTALTMASLLPFAEIVLGFALIAGLHTRLTARACGGMLIMFILALLSLKARGLTIPNCGCFGSSIHLSPFQAIGLDSFLLIGAVLASRFGDLRLSLDNWIAAGTSDAKAGS